MKREYNVGAADSIRPGQHRVVDAGGRQIGIFNVDGNFYALPNACFHQNGPLCRGRVSGTLIADAQSDHKPEWRLDGEVIICPWHSLEFHIKTGRCLAYANRKVPTYPVRVKDGVLNVTC
jgi:nitrite reductase/ring-hydroxylating ferredoxin subunit